MFSVLISAPLSFYSPPSSFDLYPLHLLLAVVPGQTPLTSPSIFSPHWFLHTDSHQFQSNWHTSQTLYEKRVLFLCLIWCEASSLAPLIRSVLNPVCFATSDCKVSLVNAKYGLITLICHSSTQKIPNYPHTLLETEYCVSFKQQKQSYIVQILGYLEQHFLEYCESYSHSG